MFKVGDRVSVGMFEGVIVRLYDFHAERWAEVKIDGWTCDYRTLELRRISNEK